jgi:hypothetical protein
MLSELDTELSDAWRKASGAGDVTAAVRSEQLQWLKRRDACGADTSCLSTRYNERLHAFVSEGSSAGDVRVAGSMQSELLVPRSANADGGNVAVRLLLNPCLSDQALKDMSEEPSVLSDAVAARKALPPGACDDPVLVEKIFAARFLQYAVLDMASEPWSFDAILATQNKRTGQCKDTRCLRRELDSIIDELSPAYLKGQAGWPRGKGLCTTEPKDTPVKNALSPLDAASRRAILGECGGEAVTAQACGGPHGKLLFLSCAIEGNQVNAPQWLYRQKNMAEPLLATEDGPLGVMESYSYTALGVGADDNGNDLEIAQGGPDRRVICH